MKRLFVYGKLMDDELVRHLTGKEFQQEKARLEGYTTVKIGKDDYETAAPIETDGRVPGKVLNDVDRKSFEDFDNYENDEDKKEWRRKIVRVKLESGKHVCAWVYVWRLPSTWLWVFARLVGWEHKVPPLSETVHPSKLEKRREKCRASLTSVSVFFGVNSALLALLANRLFSPQSGPSPLLPSPSDWWFALLLWTLVLLLSLKTWGLSDFKSLLNKTCVSVPMLVVGLLSTPYFRDMCEFMRTYASIPVTASGVFTAWGFLLLVTSEFFLVFSLEFYDSALNPDIDAVDVSNLEFAGSRFYFVALWLTILSALLFVWPIQPYLVAFGLLCWALALIFVGRFEDAYKVKQ